MWSMSLLRHPKYSDMHPLDFCLVASTLASSSLLLVSDMDRLIGQPELLFVGTLHCSGAWSMLSLGASKWVLRLRLLPGDGLFRFRVLVCCYREGGGRDILFHTWTQLVSDYNYLWRKSQRWLVQAGFQFFVNHEHPILPERPVRCNAGPWSHHDDRYTRIIWHVKSMCLSNDTRNHGAHFQPVQPSRTHTIVYRALPICKRTKETGCNVEKGGTFGEWTVS